MTPSYLYRLTAAEAKVAKYAELAEAAVVEYLASPTLNR